MSVTDELPAGDRYVVISSDCHAGASIRAYRDYLASDLHDEFDAWMETFDNPYKDLTGDDAERNWDSDRRLAEMEADGVVGEVIFPNTIPPFFPAVSLVNQAPPANAGDLDRRWAGLQAHNRWRLLRRRPGTPGGHRPDHAPRCRRRGRRGAVGDTDLPAASCFRAPRPDRASPRSTTSATSRCGPCARSSACR